MSGDERTINLGARMSKILDAVPSETGDIVLIARSADDRLSAINQSFVAAIVSQNFLLTVDSGVARNSAGDVEFVPRLRVKGRWHANPSISHPATDLIPSFIFTVS